MLELQTKNTPANWDCSQIMSSVWGGLDPPPPFVSDGQQLGPQQDQGTRIYRETGIA